MANFCSFPEGRTVYASEFWGDDMGMKINNAIVYGLNNLAGKVIIPAGIWEIDTPTGFDDRSAIRLIGSGAGLTILKPKATFIGIAVVSVSGSLDCEMSDLTLDGSGYVGHLYGVFGDGTTLNPNYGRFVLRSVSFLNWAGKTPTQISAGVGKTVVGVRHENVTLPDQSISYDLGLVPIPSARVHLPPGTAAPGAAPLKIPAGILNTVPEAGAEEADSNGDRYHVNAAGARKKYIDTDSAGDFVYTGNIGAAQPYGGTQVGVWLISRCWEGEAGYVVGLGLNCYWDGSRWIVLPSAGSSGAALITQNTADGVMRIYTFANNGNFGYSLANSELPAYLKIAIDTNNDVILPGTLQFTNRTALRPLKLDANKKLISDKINLSSGDETQGVLPIAQLPTGTTTSHVALGAHIHSTSAITNFNSEVSQLIATAMSDRPTFQNVVDIVNAAVAGYVQKGTGISVAVTGTADLDTGAVTGTGTGTVS